MAAILSNCPKTKGMEVKPHGPLPFRLKIILNTCFSSYFCYIPDFGQK